MGSSVIDAEVVLKLNFLCKGSIWDVSWWLVPVSARSPDYVIIISDGGNVGLFVYD